jgi:hypothetical protein
MPICHHVKTLAVTSSRPDAKTLAMCDVLAHPRAAFHSFTCGLRGGADAFVAALINYNDLGLLPR